MIQFPEVPRRRGKPMDMRDLNRTLGWRKGLVENYRALSARLLEEPLLELNSCSVCEASELKPFVVIHGFPYVECAAWGHLFSSAVIEVPRHPSLSSFAALTFPADACRHLYAPEHLHVCRTRASRSP